MDIELKVVEVYNQIANEFSEKRYYIWSWIANFLKTFNKNSKILDIGCGNGRNMLYPNLDFTGIDNCDGFINICNSKQLNVLKSDMTNIPFPDNSFDGIISIASFHHLSTIDRREKCLREMKRLLNKNGKILLSVWSKDQKHNKKLNFNFGDNYIPWKDNKGHIKGNRYYYIFKFKEIRELLQKYFNIEKCFWYHGNEIFILNNF